MLICKLYTKDYKHDFFFEFRGKKYPVHSIVRLTEYGQKYFESRTKEAILLEQFVNWEGDTCWKYQFRGASITSGIVDYSTDVKPNKLIEEVVVEASVEYASREIHGVDSPVYKTGKKNKPKDWNIPEVRKGWIFLIVFNILISVFQPWYTVLLLRIVSGWIFGLYRQSYIEAHTTYEHDEDTEILKKKVEVLYGIKINKEDNTNE